MEQCTDKDMERKLDEEMGQADQESIEVQEEVEQKQKEESIESQESIQEESVQEEVQEEESVEEETIQEESHQTVEEIIEKIDEDSEELTEEQKKHIEKVIEDVCQMKADELRLMGIKTSGQQVWQCVSSGYKKGYPEYHQVVNDVLSLKSTKFMNWLLIQAQKGIYTP